MKVWVGGENREEQTGIPQRGPGQPLCRGAGTGTELSLGTVTSAAPKGGGWTTSAWCVWPPRCRLPGQPSPRRDPPRWARRRDLRVFGCPGGHFPTSLYFLYTRKQRGPPSSPLLAVLVSRVGVGEMALFPPHFAFPTWTKPAETSPEDRA